MIIFINIDMIFSSKINWLVQQLHTLPETKFTIQFGSVVMSDSLQPHGLQHARLPCPSPTPRACSNSCPSSRWCHEIMWQFTICHIKYAHRVAKNLKCRQKLFHPMTPLLLQHNKFYYESSQSTRLTIKSVSPISILERLL